MPFTARTQPDNSHKQDSLRRAIADTDGLDRLKSYMRLAEMYATHINDALKTDTLFTIYNEMEAEAQRQGNAEQQALVKENRIGAYYNRKAYDEVIGRVPDAIEFMAANGMWRSFYRTRLTLTETFRRQGDYEQALGEAEKMYDYAKERDHRSGMGMAMYAMANVYSFQRRYAEAEECAREAIDILKGDEGYLDILPSIYNRLIGSAVGQGHYKEAMEVAKESEDVIRRYEEASGLAKPGAWYNLWVSYLDIYRQTGDAESVLLYADKIDSITGGRIKSYKERGHALYIKGRYAEAVEMLDMAIETNPRGQEAEALKLSSLVRLGKGEEADALFRRIIIKQDSIRNMEYNGQLDALRTRYEVDKHIAEKERQRLIAFWAITGCLLLALLAVIFIVYSRKLRKKNLSLYRQINEERRLEKEAEEAQARIPQEQLTRERKLYLELQSLMHSEKPFTDPDIDRNGLAGMLGTNRQYLADAVKQETGLTLSAYIGALRLKYALELLDGNPGLTLEAVAVDSGHGSYSSFFRAFTQKYGMTPSEYRRFSTDKTVLPTADGEE